MWLECCGCSSWSTIRSRAGEIHYAHSIMPPSGAARKIPLKQLNSCGRDLVRLERCGGPEVDLEMNEHNIRFA